MGETLGDDTLRLRDVEDADLEVFLEYEHDPEAVRRSRFTPRERDAFMTHWRTRVLQPPGLVQTVLGQGHRHAGADPVPRHRIDATAVRRSVRRHHGLGQTAGAVRVPARRDSPP
jgi:hypothetical protein